MQRANAPPQTIAHEELTMSVEDALKDCKGARMTKYQAYSGEQGACYGLNEFRESLSRYLRKNLPAKRELTGAAMLQVETTCTSGTIRSLHVVNAGAAQWRNVICGVVGLLILLPQTRIYNMRSSSTIKKKKNSAKTLLSLILLGPGSSKFIVAIIFLSLVAG